MTHRCECEPCLRNGGARCSEDTTDTVPGGYSSHCMPCAFYCLADE